MADEQNARLESMITSNIIKHNKAFVYRGRWSWEMTHEELINCCIEMHDMWKQTQSDYMEALKTL